MAEPSPAENGHQFHFAVYTQASVAVVGGPHTDATEPDPDPFRATVRAWNLRDACRAAADVPLHRWHLSVPRAQRDVDLKARLLALRQEILQDPALTFREVEDLKAAVLLLVMHLNHRAARVQPTTREADRG